MNKKKRIPSFNEEIETKLGSKDEFVAWLAEKSEYIKASGLLVSPSSFAIGEIIDDMCDPASKGMRKGHNVLAISIPKKSGARVTAGGIVLPDSAPEDREDVKIMILVLSLEDGKDKFIPALVKAYGNQELGDDFHLVPTQHILMRYREDVM